MKKQHHVKIAVTALSLFTTVTAFGQTVKVTGRVLDTDGSTPMVGVTVQQKGAKTGTVTDIDGKFTLTVNGQNPSLSFSYLGYQTTTLSVAGSKKDIRVIMKPESKSLNEVVVTALGIKREEKSLGYSVSKLDNKELTKGISGNWLEQMNGKVAGLQMSQAGTGPLGTMRVTLRGDHSLNHGNNGALFVVDGVPIQSGTVATGSGATYNNTDAPVDFGNGASDINPDDIESVTVLKGAAATALYGSAAGNGAIVITTKGGGNVKKWGVSLSSSLVWEVASYWPDFQKEYGSGSDMGLSPYAIHDVKATESTAGLAQSSNYSRYSFGEKFGAGKTRYQYNSYDWETGMWTPTPWEYQDDWYTGFFQTGTTLRNNVSITGGNGKGTSGRLSFTDTRNNWITPNTGFVDDAVSFGFDSPVSKRIKISSRANFINRRSDNLPASGYSAANPMYQLGMGYNTNSIEDWKSEYFNGRFTKENMEKGLTVYRSDKSFNPYRTAYEELNSMNKSRVYGNIMATISLVKGLDLKLRSALDMTHTWRTQQRPFYTTDYETGMYREQTTNIYRFNNDFLLSYTNNKLVGDRLGFNASFGGNSYDYRYYNDRITLEKMQVDGVYNVYNVPSGYSPDVFSYHSKKKVNSFYGFLNLSWDNTYYLEFTDRNDWSSTLAKGHNSYNYPSVSATVLLDQVFNFREKAPWVDMLKLKASWANVGNDTSPYSLDRYYSNTSYFGGYRISNTIPNANIKPENEESWEGGVEGKMFGGRLGFDFTLYTTNTTNQIVDVAADQITGATGYTINAGKISSKGIELSLSGTPVRTRNFEWNITANASRNWNKLVALQDGWDPKQPYQLDNGTTIGNRIYVYSYVGHEMYHLYGHGYVRAPEGSYYLDKNGNKVDCSGQKIISSNGMPLNPKTSPLIDLGRVNPTWTGGLNMNFRIKNVTVSMDFSAQVGGHAYSTTNFLLSYQGRLKNSLKGRYDGFVVEGVQQHKAADGTITYTKNNTVMTSALTYYNQYVWVRDNAEENTFSTNFIKFKQLRVDYSLPKALCKKTHFLESASLGAYATNLFCITPFPQYDPETAMVNGAEIYSGIETLAYPMTRQYGINLKLSF